MSHQCTHTGTRRPIIRKSIVAAIVVLVTSTHATASEARFIPLPENFVPTAISGDGSVVAGWIGKLDDREAALWTEADGVERLGFLPNDVTSLAYDISADGSVIVGTSWLNHLIDQEAFRWTRETGMVGLGVPPGRDESLAFGVSGDGAVLVGFGSAPGPDFDPEAFRWTEEGGMVGIGGRGARVASWDGSVIAGNGNDESSRAFRWTSETGLTYLESVPVAPGESSGWYPEGMSLDGRLIVGTAYVGERLRGELVRWTEAGGIETLPDWESTFPWLNDDVQSTGSDMSDDGSTVIGGYRVYTRPDGTTNDTAGSFVWDEEHGFRDLHDLLVNEHGLAAEMSDWTAEWTLAGTYAGARSISYDGRRIVGWSFEQGGLCPPYPCNSRSRGWLAILGPPYQPGDANRDDVFNSSDLVQVFQAGQYEDDVAGNSLWKDGDWTWDGEFNSSDLVAAFEAGAYEVQDLAAVRAVPEPGSMLILMGGLIGIAFCRRNG